MIDNLNDIYDGSDEEKVAPKPTPAKAGPVPASPVNADNYLALSRGLPNSMPRAGASFQFNQDAADVEKFMGEQGVGDPALTGQDNTLLMGQRQSGWNKLGRRVVNLVPNIASQLVGMVGYTGALLTEWGDDRDYSNAFTEAANAMKDPAGINYRRSNDTFALSDPTWWIDNTANLIETAVPFALEAGFVGNVMSKVAGVTGKALEAGQLGSRITQALAQASTAAFTAYSESAMSGSQVFEKTYQTQLDKLLAKGYSLSEAQKRAQHIAAESAATTVQLGTALTTVLNLSSVAPFFKNSDDAALDVLRNQFRKTANESTEDWIKRIGSLEARDYAKQLFAHQGGGALLREMGQEGVEEIAQQFAQVTGEEEGEKGTIHGLLDQFKQLGKFFDRTMDEQGALSFILGAVGGAGQTVLINSVVPSKRTTYDSQGNQIQKLNKDGTLKFDKGKPVYEKHWVTPRTYDKWQTQSVFNDARDAVVSDIEFFAEKQNEFLEAKAKGNDVKADQLIDQMFNITNIQAVKTGLTNEWAETYDGIKNMTQEEAIKTGYAKDENDTSYKEKATEAIESLQTLQKEYTKLQNKFGTQYESNQGVKALVDNVFARKAQLMNTDKIIRRHEAQLKEAEVEEQEMAELANAGEFDQATMDYHRRVQSAQEVYTRLKEDHAALEKALESGDMKVINRMIKKYRAAGVNDTNLNGAIKELSAKIANAVSNQAKKAKDAEEALFASAGYNTWREKNPEGKFEDYRNEVQKKYEISQSNIAYRANIEEARIQHDIAAQSLGEMLKEKSFSKLVKNANNWLQKLVEETDAIEQAKQAEIADRAKDKAALNRLQKIQIKALAERYKAQLAEVLQSIEDKKARLAKAEAELEKTSMFSDIIKYQGLKSQIKTLKKEIKVLEAKARHLETLYNTNNIETDSVDVTMDEDELAPAEDEKAPVEDTAPIVETPQGAMSAEESKAAELDKNRRQALIDIIALTGEPTDYVADGTWNGEGLLGFDENGNVVLTRYADNVENLTKSGKVTSPAELRQMMNNFGGEQIPTSGLAGGLTSFSNKTVGEYRIPLEEFKELIKEGYIQFAGFGNKEFVLSPHIAVKYLHSVNGVEQTQNTSESIEDAELAEIEGASQPAPSAAGVRTLVTPEKTVDLLAAKRADIERRRQEELERALNNKKQELADINEISSFGETYSDALDNLIKKQQGLNNSLNKRQKEETKDRDVKQYTQKELEVQPEWEEIKKLDRLINQINEVYGSSYGFDAKTSEGVKEVQQELKELPNKRKTADANINAKYDAELAALTEPPPVDIIEESQTDTPAIALNHESFATALPDGQADHGHTAKSVSATKVGTLTLNYTEFFDPKSNSYVKRGNPSDLNTDANLDVLLPDQMQAGHRIAFVVDTEYNGNVNIDDEHVIDDEGNRGQQQESFKDYVNANGTINGHDQVVGNVPIKVVSMETGKTVGYVHRLNWVNAKYPGTSDHRNIVEFTPDEDGELTVDNIAVQNEAILQMRRKIIDQFNTNPQVPLQGKIVEKGAGQLILNWETNKNTERSKIKPELAKNLLPASDIKIGIVVSGEARIGLKFPFDGEKAFDSIDAPDGSIVALVPGANGKMLYAPLVGEPLTKRKTAVQTVARAIELYLAYGTDPNVNEEIEKVKTISGFDIRTEDGLRNFINQYFTYTENFSEAMISPSAPAKNGKREEKFLFNIWNPLGIQGKGDIKIGWKYSGRPIISAVLKNGKLSPEFVTALQEGFETRARTVVWTDPSKNLRGVNSSGEFKDVSYTTDGRWVGTTHASYNDYVKSFHRTAVYGKNKVKGKHVYTANPNMPVELEVPEVQVLPNVSTNSTSLPDLEAEADLSESDALMKELGLKNALTNGPRKEIGTAPEGSKPLNIATLEELYNFTPVDQRNGKTPREVYIELIGDGHTFLPKGYNPFSRCL